MINNQKQRKQLGVKLRPKIKGIPRQQGVAIQNNSQSRLIQFNYGVSTVTLVIESMEVQNEISHAILDASYNAFNKIIQHDIPLGSVKEFITQFRYQLSEQPKTFATI